MKKFFTVTLIAAMLITLVKPFELEVKAAEDGNDYPVVLCHGLGGWGRDEKNGFLYWGGDVDIQDELRDEGYEVYTGVVGPYSSNWDRACELYAYIKGGKVDYGKAHSEEHGHNRYGREFEGLINSWGTEDEDGINKIHLIGHSQGGQTVRVLVQLLEEGMKEEVEAVVGEDATEEEINKAVENGELSKLFTGTCNEWVESVTTLATPNDGSTFANIAAERQDILTFLLAPLGGITGLTDDINYIDLKLDQWGLHRDEDECLLEYMLRVLGNELWYGTEDFSFYDLGTEGAREINSWVEDQENVYYFSYSCEASKESWLTGHHIPDSRYMNPNFYFGTMVMGAHKDRHEGIDEDWYPNDGYVNTISEDGPKLGRSSNNIVEYDGTPEIGRWNHMGVLDKTDHEDIIGRDTSDEIGDIIEFYSDHIDMLLDL
jgi:triacylglycerol lipase